METPYEEAPCDGLKKVRVNLLDDTKESDEIQRVWREPAA
jgi:hypothetical protein